MKKGLIKLPKLAFGDASAVVERDVISFRDRMATVVTSLEYYEADDPEIAFQSKTSAITINGMRVAAAANTPVSVKVGDSTDLTLMVPLEGRSVSVWGAQKFTWYPQHAAMFFPNAGREGGSGIRSNLNLDLKRNGLPEPLQPCLAQKIFRPLI